MNDSKLSDDGLLQLARSFDPDALAEVYDRHSDELFRYAWRLLGDVDHAEECVAETFSRFLHAVKRGGGPKQHLRAYLFRTAHNWITDYYRRRTPPSLPLDPEVQAGGGSEPAQVVLQDIELQEMRDALLQLTPEQRQVVVLRYLEDWEHVDIARAMHRRVGAVKALQHRAIQALKRLIGEPQEVRK